MVDTGSGKIRVDKWLWYARVVKTRSRAQNIIKTGKVRVNSTRISSVSSNISVGDVLTIALERQIKVLKVQAPGTRRGPAPEAQLLYEDLSPPPSKKEDIVWSTNTVAVRDEGAGRPTKKQRRETMRFRENAARSDYDED